MPIPALALAALPSLFQLGTSLFQGAEARKLGKAERPTYERPQEAVDLLTRAKAAASQQEAPGTRLTRERIGSQVAGGIGAAKEAATGADILGATTNLVGQQIEAERGLSVEDELFRQQQQEKLTNELVRGAGYSDVEFQTNVMQPFMDTQAAAARQREAANVNLARALESIGGIGLQQYRIKELGKLGDIEFNRFKELMLSGGGMSTGGNIPANVKTINPLGSSDIYTSAIPSTLSQRDELTRTLLGQ